MYVKIYKPFFDFLISLILMIVFLPVFILITLMLIITNRGKPFFIQPRPGKHEKIFNVIKFKTMNDKRDSEGNLLPDFKRVTWIGSFIRKTSLDEIPQLINVLMGDMSFVGPRPLLVEYLPLYNNIQKKRHTVKPGITGWAQVNGRNAITWDEKFKLDLYYVDNFSFCLDFKIFVLTILKVLRSEDVNSSSTITMEKFNGNN